ncbi:hypothetical protein, partial [Clostridium perfringens]|uniref:hypothetical protein n=1 Tax=Clostridium perfringens TaxID=1502 RepID=UPI001CCF8DEB
MIIGINIPNGINKSNINNWSKKYTSLIKEKLPVKIELKKLNENLKGMKLPCKSGLDIPEIFFTHFITNNAYKIINTEDTILLGKRDFFIEPSLIDLTSSSNSIESIAFFSASSSEKPSFK